MTPEPVSSEEDLTGDSVSHAAADDRARVIAAQDYDVSRCPHDYAPCPFCMATPDHDPTTSSEDHT